MKKIQSRDLVFLLISLAIFLPACGGSDGGDSGGGGGITYTGITAQAAIDSTNAKILSEGAYEGGAIGSTGSLGTIQQTTVDRPYYFDMALILEEAILRIDVHAPPGVVQAGAIVRESGTIPGDCGGNAQYTIELDDVTGSFSGTLNFVSYCSQGVMLTGIASFSGAYDIQNDAFLQFSLSYDNITVSSGSDSITAKMTITFNFQTTPATATMDILLRNNNDGKVYWVAYTMNFWAGSNYVDFSVSGKYYHPDYGYVVISTPTVFRVYSGSDWPSQGVLILNGKTGIAGGSTKAQLTVISSTTYQVEADTNGDGIYDWNSGMLTWS